MIVILTLALCAWQSGTFARIAPVYQTDNFKTECVKARRIYHFGLLLQSIGVKGRLRFSISFSYSLA